MQVSATETKNRFGSLCAQAKRDQAFKAEYADWIAAQNAFVEAQGVPATDMRPW
jgi:post-segregation antitoxin (ccd killing protein)